jgi:predicted TPR repeat methyltransferase
MSDERLAWIYSATSPEELQERYDWWASEYDADLAGLHYVAPRAGAERCHHWAGDDARVLDAGCGTGLVGEHLRLLGVAHLTGFDLSQAMLDQAAERGVYDVLRQGSLLEPLPFPMHSFDAVVSVGVFTFGHVGPEALSLLPDMVRAGGHVVMTFRDDVMNEMGFAVEAERLERDGVWRMVECTAPAPLIVEDGVGAPMRVWTWQVP